jgi:hypothetical protein
MTNYVLAFRGRPDRNPAEGEGGARGAWFGSLGPAVIDFGHRVARNRWLTSLGDRVTPGEGHRDDRTLAEPCQCVITVTRAAGTLLSDTALGTGFGQWARGGHSRS